ncbi:DUF305 domain-containing protein [Porphyrobacter sp. GA68]|uniref:DUF305 domain-containing protein n=1 Tax=Porphyrobacter sp. GA68 TaxID=2883480 RepID=UPI001D18705E|nr:DUF305 domain-containing protein [Porphyrobacter sp. GA68]
MSAVALIASLSACADNDGPDQNAGATASADDSMAMSGPFGESEMRMDEAIMTAVGVNAADSWVRKIIEHHKGAVEMSRIVLAQNPSADVGMMAQQTIDKQTREIAELEKLIASGTPNPASGELYRPATMQMHEAMMGAKGADISETYLRKMLAHHQGAVAMSDVALANGASGAVRARIEKTKADQQKEVAMVEAMLRGEPMTASAPAARDPVASAPAARPAAPKPAPAKPAPARPTAEPAAQPEATPTCLPEHREAGHC